MVDKRSVYYKCHKVLEGMNGEISRDELIALISMEMGSNEKTVVNTMRVMGMTGLIKDVGNGKFKIIR